MNPSTFYLNELQRALAEHAPAITSFYIISSSPLQATASVTLLEGNSITIQVTNRGYHSQEAGQNTFETIEALLQSVSPLFNRARQRLLFDALSELSSQQTSSDHHSGDCSHADYLVLV